LKQEIFSTIGGVDPKEASNCHINNLNSIYLELLNLNLLKSINKVVATSGPGLITSLGTGYFFALALSQKIKCDFISSNHLLSHLASVFITQNQRIEEPILGLVVSGGHTIGFLFSEGESKVILNTIDDALGELYDKVGRMLELGYPAGRKIDDLAKKGETLLFSLPHVKTEDNLLSFSGIKTFVKNFLEQNPSIVKEEREDFCFSFQSGLMNYFLRKISVIVEQKKVKSIILSGGVAANSLLRQGIVNSFPSCTTLIPELHYCTDNALMLASSISCSLTPYFLRIKDGLCKGTRKIFSTMRLK